MEVNIKNKVQRRRYCFTRSAITILRIIPITIQSIKVAQMETTEDVEFDGSIRDYNYRNNLKMIIEYSEFVNVYKRTHNGYSMECDDIPFYHQEACFATKQELITHIITTVMTN